MLQILLFYLHDLYIYINHHYHYHHHHLHQYHHHIISSSSSHYIFFHYHHRQHHYHVYIYKRKWEIDEKTVKIDFEKYNHHSWIINHEVKDFQLWYATTFETHICITSLMIYLFHYMNNSLTSSTDAMNIWYRSQGKIIVNDLVCM